ncbi:MerR family transcriptional regulator [Methylorubrum extorquens]|uniref:MerR family transcriptional regulator n=1 Tax=Methylorubrum extorquens TaxID=408 RepID=UPI000158F2FB|nr:MerR family transcriptional regulator [Methylorubrum extorquens]ABY30269.1 hypothetical protein Mext_1870 [Methylorubrum extorquens PA1]KQP93670.1 hypothetical protein ASF55_20445 [Methylobacterium sp. Leaf119]WIU41569.1 helix-turn-helix domain-containing protein [Methylorubrum extorquens]
MDATQIETWGFSRTEAADIVGMTSGQIGNYLVRYDLFPGKTKGKGHHVHFRLRDLMKLGAVKALIENGLTPEQAAGALRGIQGPYGTLLHDGFGEDREPAFNYPGTLFFTRAADGKWIAADDPSKIVCILVRAWPIFDEIWPRIRAHILKDSVSAKPSYPGDAKVGLEKFEQGIEAIRAERWERQRRPETNDG